VASPASALKGAIVSGIAFGAGAGSAAAQGDPAKPVRIIVPVVRAGGAKVA